MCFSRNVNIWKVDFMRSARQCLLTLKFLSIRLVTEGSRRTKRP